MRGGTRRRLLLSVLPVVCLATADVGPASDSAAQLVGEPGVAEDVDHLLGENETLLEEHGHGHFCKRGIGTALKLPPTRKFVFSQHPGIYNVAIPVACTAFVLTLAVSINHVTALVCVGTKRIFQERAVETRIVALVPLVICFFKAMAVVIPRSWKLFFFLCAIYEVTAFWCFMQLILNLLAGGDGWTYGQIKRILKEATPQKVWAVPPCACCCKPCVSARTVLPSDMRIIKVLMWQFIVIVPFTAAMDMAELKFIEEHHKRLAQVETLSLVLAMYALFALLEVTHEALHDHRVHAKFWTIKGTFIANTAILRIVSASVDKDERVGQFCFSAETLASAWAGMITAALCMPLALLSRYAYRPDELFDKADLDSSDDEPTSDGTAGEGEGGDSADNSA